MITDEQLRGLPGLGQRAKDSLLSTQPTTVAEEVVDEHWADLVEVFRQFEDQSPILLFDIQEQRIYAYPFQDFTAELSARDQVALARQHKKATRSPRRSRMPTRMRNRHMTEKTDPHACG